MLRLSAQIDFALVKVVVNVPSVSPEKQPCACRSEVDEKLLDTDGELTVTSLCQDLEHVLCDVPVKTTIAVDVLY